MKTYALTIIYHDGTESHHTTSDPPRLVPDEGAIHFKELIEREDPEAPKRMRSWLMPLASFRATFFEEVSA